MTSIINQTTINEDMESRREYSGMRNKVTCKIISQKKEQIKFTRARTINNCQNKCETRIIRIMHKIAKSNISAE
ncbi:MAG: hypothetical protein ABIG84_04935 [archaeon]